MSKYVTLMETSEEEFESWIYFIKLDGNEENLLHLKNQLDQVDWKIYEGLSTFDIDMDHPVSESTAKEMTKVELNVYFHRKFDGKLQRINLGFKKDDSNKKKIKRTFARLGYGQIDEYVSDEDRSDDEDLVEEGDDERDSDNHDPDAYSVSSTDDSESEETEDEDDDDEEEEVEEEEVEEVVETKKELPKSLKQPQQTPFVSSKQKSKK